MSTPDFGDIGDLAAKDSEVQQLLTLLKKVLHKHGAFFLTRIVAQVLAPYRPNAEIHAK